MLQSSVELHRKDKGQSMARSGELNLHGNRRAFGFAASGECVRLPPSAVRVQHRVHGSYHQLLTLFAGQHFAHLLFVGPFELAQARAPNACEGAFVSELVAISNRVRTESGSRHRRRMRRANKGLRCGEGEIENGSSPVSGPSPNKIRSASTSSLCISDRDIQRTLQTPIA